MGCSCSIKEIFYYIVIYLVRLIKWVEFQFLKLFRPCVESYIRRRCAKFGIFFVHDSEPIADQTAIMDVEKASRQTRSEDPIYVKLHDRDVILKFANQGSLGLGESYMDGKWDCDNVVTLVRRFVRNKGHLIYYHPWNRFLEFMELRFFNLQSKQRNFEMTSQHYNLGNELFESFLDPWLQYTCGYWANSDNLNDAQLAKMELVAKKLKLKPGMRLLDIGCGWGTFCKYVAKNYGVSCVGITISEEGVKYGQETCKGLPVDIRLADYRQLNEKFDRIAVIGCIEHVGHHNYREFFKVAHRCLKDDGIFLLHTIGVNHSDFPRTERWLNTYIFPNGMLPYYKEIAKHSEGLFVIEDWHNFGPDYAKTLLAWQDNFDKSWPTLSQKYDERFYRMWTFYLRLCAGLFQSRKVNLWQIVFSKDGLENGYRAAR